MKRLVALFAVLGALAVVGGAGADPLRYGVADDWPKFHACGDVWWQSAHDIGYTELRMTVQWDAANPTVIPSQANIQAAVDCALLQNVTPVLAIYPAKPSAIGESDGEQQAFAGFVALVGRAFPGVQNFIVGNEPNVNRFWQPQYVNGQDAAGKDYEHTLAYSYDALKATRPDAIVWGPAISSRGNDDANASSNPSHSPVWFIKDMADAYKASGRSKPIFDEFDMHPYPPTQDTDPFSKPFQWPQGGAANLDRIKQALWDGFNGTAQPTPAEQAGGRTAQSARFGGQGLPIDLDEVGEQTNVLQTSHANAYTSPPENVTPIDEPTQAAHYTELAEMAACDPDVKRLLYFPLIDDQAVNTGFQSGQLYVDLTHKQSYDAMKQKIASAKGECQGGVSGVPTTWQHTTQVIGAQALFGPAADPTGAPANRPTGIGSLQVSVTANEDATFSASLVNAAGQPFGAPVSGALHAYFKPAIKWVGRIPDGTYTIRVVLTAATNPARTSTLTSSPFTVGSGGSSTGSTGSGGSGGASVSGPLGTLVTTSTVTVITALTTYRNGQPVTTYIAHVFTVLGPVSQDVVGTLTLLPLRTTATALPHVGGSSFKAKKGQTIAVPRLSGLHAGTYRLRIAMRPAAGGKTVTLTSPAFTLSAKGKLAKPKAKPKKKPKKK